MNQNLPEIKKERFILKLKRWFKRLFFKPKILEQQNDNIEAIADTEKLDFINSLQAKDNTKNFILQRKLKDKEISIKDLTDNELDDMIEFYKNRIIEKKNRLYKYRKG